MNKTATMIRNRLSLREPQKESLEILEKLADILSLEKNSNKEEEIKKIKELYPTFKEFERDFTNICFSLATGVGKTRLMGAFITYLYLKKGIQNFFVLAPNLTVYNKLIEDFSNPLISKYVFKGIAEFAVNRPVIITGDNYQTVGKMRTIEKTIRINVFNIAKINSKTKGNSVPLVKRLSEYIGESYFSYLSSLEDLVLIMDESHHYRAERGTETLNELNPILGLELTATPQTEKNGVTKKFKNVVYEYSLAKAINDGFVKEPSVATRRDFDPSQYAPEELDTIKLEDGLRIHEDTKTYLDIYARDQKVKQVKPFVLVVAKDTNHSQDLLKIIKSPTFFDDYYADKVMELHSNQKGEEKEENIQLLLSLEDPNNRIEIVIHVNMLKEGWDVTNLYTIIPLRTATSLTLREQTIGRGLRLPYGRRTGNTKVDKLTIVAHDKFQQIVDEANKPNSIIKKENIIEINDSEYFEKKEVVATVSIVEQKFVEEKKQIETIAVKEERYKAEKKLEAKQMIYETIIKNTNGQIKNLSELNDEKVKEKVMETIKNSVISQENLFSKDISYALPEVYAEVIESIQNNIIEIPRVVIAPTSEIDAGFHNFDLETTNLKFQPGNEEIMIVSLKSGEIEVIGDSGRKIKYASLENLIINELLNFAEIDYGSMSELLMKLSTQVVNHFRTYLLTEKEVMNVCQGKKRDIAKFIYTQMMEHFYCNPTSYEEAKVYPFTKILEHNYSRIFSDTIRSFRDTIEPTSLIPKLVFNGFKKACHSEYKYDSKTEKDFSIILENETSVLKWLRPAQEQFKIYWNHNSQQYHPDFVVETEANIFMIETKAQKDIETDQVVQKARAALEYIKNVNEYTKANGGKAWKYLLIPHDKVTVNTSFYAFSVNYEYTVK